LIQQGTSEKVALIIQYLATFVTGFALAYARSWRLALAMSSLLPVIAITGGMMMKIMTKWTALSLESTAKAGTLAEEVVASIRTIHAFGTARILGRKFDEHIQTMQMAGNKTSPVEGAGLGVICEFQPV
jgi:ATP-binding cassette subfamily B (MDR/TAP) protein 1